MQYWLFMFRAETYEKVKQHNTVGVRDSARKYFYHVRKGDLFISYISRVRQLDGYGEIASEVFEDSTRIFSKETAYKHRCRVRFVKEGSACPVGDLLWAIYPLDTKPNTTPANLIFCKGGLIKISQEDYDLFKSAIDGKPPA